MDDKHFNSELGMEYLQKANQIGMEKGNCEELQELCRKAYNDYKSGVISDQAYGKIYAVCVEYAYPR